MAERQLAAMQAAAAQQQAAADAALQQAAAQRFNLEVQLENVRWHIFASSPSRLLACVLSSLLMDPFFPSAW